MPCTPTLPSPRPSKRRRSRSEATRSTSTARRVPIASVLVARSHPEVDMAIAERSITAVPKEELLALLSTMMLIRRFEEKAAEMYARGRIKGFLHLYVGQEATGVGVISRLREDDYIYSHYREHGHALARGIEPRAVMAELLGKRTGARRGLGGSMHL